MAKRTSCETGAKRAGTWMSRLSPSWLGAGAPSKILAEREGATRERRQHLRGYPHRCDGIATVVAIAAVRLSQPREIAKGRGRRNSACGDERLDSPRRRLRIGPPSGCELEAAVGILEATEIDERAADRSSADVRRAKRLHDCRGVVGVGRQSGTPRPAAAARLVPKQVADRCSRHGPFRAGDREQLPRGGVQRAACRCLFEPCDERPRRVRFCEDAEGEVGRAFEIPLVCTEIAIVRGRTYGAKAEQ